MNYTLTTTEDYKPESEFALALIGEPFSGKTCLATELMPPGTAILNLDRKLAAAMGRLNGKKFYIIDPSRDKDGNETPKQDVFDVSLEAIKSVIRNPKCTGIIIDSVSELAITLEHKLVHLGGGKSDLVVGGEKCMTLNLWNPFREIMRKFILSVRAEGKPAVFIFHELIIEDEGASGIRPLIGGQLKNNITKWFTDSWRLFNKQVPQSVDPTGNVRVVRTEPLYNFQQLGHSMPNVPHEVILDRAGKGLRQLLAQHKMLCTTMTEAPSGS